MSKAIVHAELTQAVVKELLNYNPKTGALTWRKGARKWFKSDHGWRSWNTRYAGRPAFNTRGHRGYLRGCVFHKMYRSHRVIFLWMIGRWPEPECDHLNRRRSDNRWVNLRQVTAQENRRNAVLRHDNQSGFVGVHRQRRSGKYRAYINRKQLGVFASKGEAIAARIAANKQHGFSPGHGRARLLTTNQERVRT